jgi:hypothetical protein
MKIKGCIVLFFVIVLFSQSAHAEKTGIDLLRGCTNMIKLVENNQVSVEDATDVFTWNGYISGFLESNQITNTGKKMTSFCLPDKGITIEQAARIVIRYLKDNPKDLHQSARLCLLLSLQDAFPCAK